MQKKARVAPRNIQFKETVQIREIPDDDADLHNLSKRPSWDPDLTGVGRFFLMYKLIYFVFGSMMYSRKSQLNKHMLSLDLLSAGLYFFALL